MRESASQSARGAGRGGKERGSGRREGERERGEGRERERKKEEEEGGSGARRRAPDAVWGIVWPVAGGVPARSARPKAHQPSACGRMNLRCEVRNRRQASLGRSAVGPASGMADRGFFKPQYESVQSNLDSPTRRAAGDGPFKFIS